MVAAPRCYRGAFIGVATIFAFYLVSTNSAVALDIDGTDGLNTETIASRERLSDYDSSKLYGAQRVSDRDRGFAAPEGLRAGNYKIFPSIGTTVIYDDNVFGSNTGKESDFRSELTPQLNFKSQLPRHILDLSLGGKIVSYLENTSQDYANIHARADGALHFDHAHTLSANILSEINHEERGSISTPLTAAEPVRIFHNHAAAGITRDVGRLYGTLMATFDRWDYADVRAFGGGMLDQDYRDTSQFSTALRFGYRFSPGFEFIGKIRALRSLNRGDEFIDRDAKGYEAMAGLAFQTSPVLRWRVLAGIGLNDYDQADIEDINTGIVEGQVEWLPTQYITFSGTASRKIIAADAMEDAGRIETRLTARLDYEVWHNVVLNFGAEYSSADYVGITRRDTTITGSAGIQYHLNKNWLLSAGYEHTMRSSTESIYDMSRNRFRVGAKMSF